MKRIIASILTVLFFLFTFASCNSSPEYVELEGLDQWRLGLDEISNRSFLRREFLTDYPYAEGNFFYSYYDSGRFLDGLTEKAFLWLTYDDTDVYLEAKQSRLDARIDEFESFDGSEAYGFTFYITDVINPSRIVDKEGIFPAEFTAFGYCDETSTLIFLGLECYTNKEEKHLDDAVKDLPSFLIHFYGAWFDWETGVGIKNVPTDNS